MRRTAVFGSMFLVWGSFLATGCEGESNQRDTGALPESEFVAALAAASCDELEHCCIAEGNPYNRDGCHQYIEERWRALVPADGRYKFTYDAEAAAQCVEATRQTARSCKFPDEIEACSRVYNGTTPAGAPCEFQGECAQPPNGSAYCDPIEINICVAEIRGRAGDPCIGTCTQSEGRNSFCEGRSRPAEVTIANCWTNDGLYCSIGRCQPLLALGEICDNEQACAPAGRCDGVCKPRFTQGEACSGPGFGDCEEGLYCDVLTRTCERSKPPGAPCNFNNHFGECDPGYCNGDVCAPPYPFASEDLCDGDND